MAHPVPPRFVFRACTSKDKPRKGLRPNGAMLSKQMAASHSVITAIFDASNAGMNMRAAYFVKIDLDEVSCDLLQGKELARALEGDARRMAASRKELLIVPSGVGGLYLPPAALTRGKVPHRALSLEQQSGQCTLESFCEKMPRHLEKVIVDRVYDIKKFWTSSTSRGESLVYHFSPSCPEAKGDNLIELSSRPKKKGSQACRCCMMRGTGELSARHRGEYDREGAARLDFAACAKREAIGAEEKRARRSSVTASRSGSCALGLTTSVGAGAKATSEAALIEEAGFVDLSA